MTAPDTLIHDEGTPVASPASDPTPERVPDATHGDLTGDADEATRALFRLYFVRHAPAGSAGSFEGPDELRPLTRRGKERLRETRDALRLLIGTPDAIVSSPYTRAMETATALARGLKFAGEVEVQDALGHGGDASALAGILASHTGQRDLVIVGHSPDLERWISRTIGAETGPVRMDLRKAGACRVDISEVGDPPQGTLRWLIPPSVLKGLR